MDEFTLLKELMQFLDHGMVGHHSCDFLQPMWHKGPCDCGLFALFEKIEKGIDDGSIRPALATTIVNAPAYQRWKNRGEHEK